jgi:hypothetical protein
VKKKLIIIVIIALAVVLLAFYVWAPGSTPQGQPPLGTLTANSLSQFTSAFDADPNLPRLVLLLSPT